jgi:hypothetical protein
MAYGLKYTLDVVWLPDGAGPMTVPDAQRIKFQQASIVLVPGGDAPSAANFNTAISGAMVTDLEAQVLANLGQIQGFATGGG